MKYVEVEGLGHNLPKRNLNDLQVFTSGANQGSQSAKEEFKQGDFKFKMAKY